MTYVSKNVVQDRALLLAEQCIKQSIYFEVMPLPDGLYEVSVKEDSSRILHESYLVIHRAKDVVTEEVVLSFSEASAASSIRQNQGRVCFVGTHSVDARLSAGQFETIDMDDESESGFIIRPQAEEGTALTYKGEEWIEGDIVDCFYAGSYSEVRRWVSDNHASHWGRRYTMNALCDLWNELSDILVDEDGELLDERFMFFPKGSHVHDVWHLFEEANPAFLSGEAGSFIGRDHKYRSL